MRANFYNQVRQSIFKGRLSQTQLQGLEALLDALNQYPNLLLTQRAYILATAYHETAHTMQPVREARGANDAQVITRLEAAHKKGIIKSRYWERDKVTGQSYYGRGFAQLTHKANYAKAGEKLGLSLVDKPDLAMEPVVSAAILIVGMIEGWFTSRKLADYVNAGQTDYIGARRVVNGTDKAALIAGYANHFADALRMIEPPAPAATAADDEPARCLISKQVVMDWQRSKALTADGIIGPNTWRELTK